MPHANTAQGELPPEDDYDTLEQRQTSLLDAFVDCFMPPDALPPLRLNNGPTSYVRDAQRIGEYFDQAISDIGLGQLDPDRSDPLPTPDDLRRYNEIMPGAAERILAMAERQQNIRADRRRKILKIERRKIIGARLAGLSLVIAAGIALWQGQTLIALSLALAGPTMAFTRMMLGHDKGCRNPSKP